MIDIEFLKSNLYDVVGALYEVHKELGPGLNEYVYQEGLKCELQQQGIEFEKELKFRPFYKGVQMDAEYRIDFIVRNDIIIELKALSELCDDHRAQLFNYMRLKKVSSGILVNFAPQSCKIERYFYDVESKKVMNVYGKPISR